MNKREYFLRAINDGAFIRKDWILTNFATFRDKPESWTEWPYPYRLIHKGDEIYFIDGMTNGDHVLIDDVKPGEPLFGIKEPITLQPGDLKNVTKEVITNYGSIIFNAMVLIWPFGDMFEYMADRVNPRTLDREVASRLAEFPKEGEERDPTKIYIDQLQKYFEAVGSLPGLTQLCVPAASRKSITVDPATLVERDRLLKEYGDKMNDPAIAAVVEAKLIQMDREWLKGDDSEGFLIDGKSFNVARKRMFIAHGIEMGFGDETGAVYVPNSLTEGWDLNYMPVMVDSLRHGSYSRGKLTELGGESVKYFHRVYQNTVVAEDDCGETHGWERQISPEMWNGLIGLYRIVDGKSIVITAEDKDELMHKFVEIRTPMLCKTVSPSFCAKCMGDKLSRNPNGISLAAADIGSTMMYIAMALMHGKSLSTSRYKYRQALS